MAAARAWPDRRTDGLPDPVRAWVHRSVDPGVEPPGRADLDTSGEIRIGRWWRYEACQVLAPPTTSIWSATAHLGPISIEGADRYVDGVGEMRWIASGRIPVLHADGVGTTHSAAGRLASEALLVPTFALAPWIEWEAINASRAVAQITINHVIHSVEAEFDDGRLVTCSQPRWHQSGRRGRSRVFGVRFTGEATHDGITMPTNWTAGWDWDGEGWRHGPFFRAHLEAVRFSPPTGPDRSGRARGDDCRRTRRSPFAASASAGGR